MDRIHIPEACYLLLQDLPGPVHILMQHHLPKYSEAVCTIQPSLHHYSANASL